MPCYKIDKLLVGYIFNNVIYDVASWREITSYNKIHKPLSSLQIFRKGYDVHNNVAYTMTKL